ncbi:MAG: (Fe-S)-binding protein [Vicinamibacterales bacterium]
MQHAIPPDPSSAAQARMAQAVSSCVHCGFCLPACPTYRVLGEEMDAPRGRIVLMKEVLEGTLPLAGAAPHLDRCLGCLACETACPSGVRYRDLIEPMRARLVDVRPRPARRRLSLLLRVMESPAFFRLAAIAGLAARPFAPMLPASTAAMLALLPDGLPAPRGLPAVTPAAGRRRGRVALMTGCVQAVLRPETSAAAARVLAANGVEVVAPAGQGCCGALALHSGELARGAAMARRHLDRFPADVDAVVTTAAGCGSSLKDHHSGHGPPVADVTEYLDRLGPSAPMRLVRPLRVAYQDACHLAHAQQVTSAPRRLLGAVEGLTLVPIAEAGVCCGSAGLYNIEQPSVADALGRRKAAAVLASGAEMAVTANIGCLTQLQTALARLGAGLEVRHLVELLDMALPPHGRRQ